MEAPIPGYISTTIRVRSFIPSKPKDTPLLGRGDYDGDGY